MGKCPKRSGKGIRGITVITRLSSVRFVFATAAVALAIGLMTGAALATVGYTWDNETEVHGNTRFCGFGDNDFLFDTNYVADGDFAHETVLWTSPEKTAIVSGEPVAVPGSNPVVFQVGAKGEFLARGEVVVNRPGGTTTNDRADVWMKSDSDSQVMCDSNGDVVVTLGNGRSY